MMNSFRAIIAGIVFLLFLAPSASPAGIYGSVTDSETGVPLTGANVMLDGTRLGTITDTEGSYFLQAVEPGNYSLSASFVGYRISRRKVKVSASDREINFSLEPIILSTDEVVLTASRAREGETPASFTNIDGRRLRDSYWAQDIPPLLETIPGLYAYSEAGTGIGYTHLKIRGFDQKRVAVTINNFPLNDPEDGTVYWVDMPDLAANLEDVQVQRGVGFSPYGTGGFGGTVNLLTLTPGLADPGFKMNLGAGSFNTRKWGFSCNSGIVNNTYGFYGRFSHIQTDGYRDRSGVTLWSYFLTGVRYGEKTLLRLNVYGGPEVTHAAWEASAESDLDANRRHNPIVYENTIDNFNQPHYELHHEWELAPDLLLENGLFYIHGKGYYEQFKSGRDLVVFGFHPFERNGELVAESDVVNQKGVEKDHFGWLPRINWEHDSGRLIVGGDLQYYTGDHRGFVIWGQDLPSDALPRNNYYKYDGEVNQGGLFIHEIYRPMDRWHLIGDLEYRFHKYTFKQKIAGNFRGDELNRFTMSYAFLNPKIGASYQLYEGLTLYSSLGISHRQPTDDEYWDIWDGPDDLGVDPLFETPDTVRSDSHVEYIEWSDPSVEPEQVVDFELGASWFINGLKLKTDLYWMDFRNEIIPAGGVRDGTPVVDNAARSIHRGIEFEALYEQESGYFCWINLTLSDDRLIDHTVYDYDADWNTIPVDLSKNRIALFPGIIASGGEGYRNRYFTASFDIRHVGKQYLDSKQLEDRTIKAYTLFGLTCSYRLPELVKLTDFELKLRINNLLNIRYETSGWHDPWVGENFYFVGAERNAFLSLITNF